LKSIPSNDYQLLTDQVVEIKRRLSGLAQKLTADR
jgi:hypothetical protein